MLVSIDVSALYTNIPQDEGLEAVREVLLERKNPEVPTDFLIRMLEIILKYNIFEFNKELYLQLIGTAMGTRPAVSYANIFMARRIDKKILSLAAQLQDEKNPLLCFKRFLDDIFTIYTGTLENLHNFLEELNKIHPTIKFTMNHTTPYSHSDNPAPLPTCACCTGNTLPFLDTACSISEKKIIVDLYRKPTDRNQYLLPSSCHPAHVTNNIPFSLAYRIIRICSNQNTRDKRLEELKQLLIERNYKKNIINSAINRAKQIPRKKALERVNLTKNEDRRPVFSVMYDPRLPALPSIVKKHWRTMVGNDAQLKEVFPLPPLVAYRRPQNIRDKIVRSKIPSTPKRIKRMVPGMSKCNNCVICPFVKEGKTIQSTSSKYTVDINRPVNCQTKNILYGITCEKCSLQYISESEQTLKDRLSEHKSYVVNSMMKKATGEHFNSKGHKVYDMKISILEKIFSPDPVFFIHFVDEEREKQDLVFSVKL